ncbi:MAG: sel1 repeat family protein [Candidatus Adiutrix sp.]|jgi:hypothetical protein|nr:sel1 repeat family protein [Candidatus Adiutrix sp.]
MVETGSETPEMMFEMGKRFYLPSSGVADPLLAQYYFQKSAEAGYAPAQRVLGTCYLEGRFTAPDYDQARRWLADAARQKDGQAAYSLALMYIRGLGVPKDWDLAFKLLDMECARHLADARMMKEQLRQELSRPFPGIGKYLAGLEKERRATYTSHRRRFIQPWDSPGRPQLEKEEFDLWLALNRKTIAPEQGQIELAGLLKAYYDQEEALHPPEV